MRETRLLGPTLCVAVVALCVGGCGTFPGVFGAVASKVPAGSSKPRVYEFNIHSSSRSERFQQDIVRESSEAFAGGEAFLSIYKTNAANAEFVFAFDNFFLNLDVFEDSPLVRASFYELCKRAELYRDRISLYSGPDEPGGAAPWVEEESLLDELTQEDLTPITVDPELEHLIEQDILEQRFDIPLVVNRQVMASIQYLTNDRRRRSVEVGLERLSRYKDLFLRVFKEAGLPLDLIYLGLVESNFNPYAYSRAKAKGIWQFIPDTGRAYGLRVDWWVDERCDPEKSTVAACKYLKALYGMFQDWSLVMAGYNTGEFRIVRILNNQPGKSYWDMCADGNLPRETQGYVPAISAAIIVGKNPGRFGMQPQTLAPWSPMSIDVPSPTDLRVIADFLDIPEDVLRDLNPHLVHFVTPPDQPTYPLNVPANTPVESLVALKDLPVTNRLYVVRHEVKRGETLRSIARQYNVSATAVRAYNGIGARTAYLRPRTSLQIPLSPSFRGPSGGSENGYDAGPPSQRVIVGAYKVKRGDTLKSIARRFDVSVDDIARWNRLTDRTAKVGAILKVRGAAAGRAATSSPRSSGTPGAGPPAGGDGALRYTVRRGDTVRSIGLRFGVNAAQLQSANGLKKAERVAPGRVLVIPRTSRGRAVAGGREPPAPLAKGSARAKVHTVRKGENIWDIARHYKVSVNKLMRANNLRGTAVKSGDRLMVPQS